MLRRTLFALSVLVMSCTPPAVVSNDAAPIAPSASVVVAAPPSAAGVPAARPLVLHAARALAPATGTVIAPAWVVIAGDEIVSVSSTPPTDTSDVRELGDATILPGLIDAHTHLLHVEAPDEGSMVAESVMMSEADRALRGASFALEMLHAGFTTVRDLGNSGRSGDVALKRAIQKGWVPGPSMVVSTRALAPPGGQFPHLAASHLALVDQEYVQIGNPSDGRAAVRQALYEGADVIKVIVDHGPGRTMTLEELRAIVETAHERGKKVAAHVLTAKAAEMAVTAGVDSCDHAYEITDATLGEMARKKIHLVPTDFPMSYYERFLPAGPKHDVVLDSMKKFRASSIDRLGRAHKLHVPIAAGSDAYVATDPADRGKDAALIFRAYAEAGLTPLEVVQAATSNAATLLGLPEKTCSMAKGGTADLVVVRGDPTKDVDALTHVVLVVKAGKVVHV